jgi:propionyl-CoA carboxylase alpha chain
VEFVVGKDQGFYFLEMNTRLQVEHPVTECITGVDLVEQMICVAAGQPLPFTQAEIPRRGWAMECRINAEDPFRGFLPSIGRLVSYRPPEATMVAAQPMPEGGGEAASENALGGVRVDTGVVEGGEIPMYYDSMIAKLIVHGTDRADAIRKMRAALNAFVIRGVGSNIPFQAALLAHPKFVSGEFNTGFIAEHYPHSFSSDDVQHADQLFMVALAAFVRRKARERSTHISGQLPGHGVKHLADLVVVVLAADGAHQHHAVKVAAFDPASGRARVQVGARSFDIESTSRLGEVLMSGLCDGQPFSAQVERSGAKNPLGIRVAHNGAQIETLVLLPRAAALLQHMPHKPPPDLSRFLLSPMPGLLVNVAVQPGQKVTAGQRLAVIEAMKMENILLAHSDGTVAEVLAQQGESLAVDQPILSFS